MARSSSVAEGLGVVAAGCLLAALVALAWPLPATWFEHRDSRRVVDRHGRLLAERVVPDRGRSQWVELDEVSPALVTALIASEDHRFGWTPGVDPIAVGRAVVHNLRAGHIVEGGSTLHQQTARLLAPRDPGWGGKGLEALRAMRLWAHLSDREVLTWYLNRAYFGQGAYGVAAAARRTFDESPSSLSLSEAATLVGLLPAPSALHPAVDPVGARAARDRVLDRMVRYAGLDPAAAATARAEPLETRRPPVDGVADQFVEHVLRQDPDHATLETTLDLELQRAVVALASEQVGHLADRHVSQAAVLVVHLPDREVRAWVGSADLTAPDGQVDGVTAYRSPGSALKPLLYGAAFDEGMDPSEVLFDVESRYGTTHGAWAPENYDRRFSGPVSARVALGSSLNIPAVRVLERLGVAAFQARLDAAGMRVRRTATSLGLGLSLGNVEVTLYELARVDAALAGDGRVRPLRVLQTDPRTDPGVRLVRPETAALVTEMLSDPTARALSFGRWGPLERPYPAAVKTGTSTGFRDNWTVGWTREWLVATWVGNFDGSPMDGVSGVMGAAPLWADVLDLATGGSGGPFPAPDGFVQGEVCALSGGSPGPECPRASEWIREGRRPPDCSWHRPGCGVAWPAELQTWALDHHLPSCVDSAPPTTLSIRWPEDGTVVWIDPRLPADEQELPLRAEGASGASFRWRIDGEDAGAGASGQRFRWMPAGPGSHLIEVVVEGAAVDRRTVVVRGGP